MNILPEGWSEVSLGDAAKIIDGDRGKNYPNGQDFSSDGYCLFLNTKNTPSTNFSFSEKMFITDEKDSLLRKGKLERGDFVLTTRGTIGNYAYFSEDVPYDNIRINSGMVILRTTVEKGFFYYYLGSNLFKHQVLSLQSGSAQPQLPIKDLKTFVVNLPHLPEQKAIADMLSSFDEKIELLREQNKTLETLAQTIFKEWFVNFNYPDATGEMVDSELGEIPKGWRVYELAELVDMVNGYSYKGKELVESSDEALVTLKSFNRNGGFQTRGFKPFSGTPKPQQEVLIGDLVVAHTDLTQDAEVLGNPAFVFEDGGFNKMFITMDLVKVNSKVKDIENAFLYYVMKDRRFKGHCVGYSNGTTVLHLSKKAIPEYTIAMPENLELAKEFSDMAYSMTRKISNNIKQIQTLSKSRDTLLPKLMSGQVRV